MHKKRYLLKLASSLERCQEIDHIVSGSLAQVKNSPIEQASGEF
jgi:hypothetical protein